MFYDKLPTKSIFISCQNITFCDCKANRVKCDQDLDPDSHWIRTRIEEKSWIRIRTIETNADPQHCVILAYQVNG
jgi:hypothetical protein